MSYEKDLSNFRVIESSLQDIFSNLESVTTEDLVKSLDSLVEFVEDYKVKLQTREKIESYLLDFDKYPTEAFTEILKVLEKFETPDAEFSVDALDDVPCDYLSKEYSLKERAVSYAIKSLFGVPSKSLEKTIEDSKKTLRFPVVEISGNKYEKVPEDEDCLGCYFSKSSGGCSRPPHHNTGSCTAQQIIYKKVSTDD